MKRIAIIAGGALAIPAARAHCPLCTTAVGGAVIGAAAIGMPVGIVALLGGAFVASTGLWTARILRKRYKWAEQNWVGPALALAALASLLIPLRAIPSVLEASKSAELITIGRWEWMIWIDWLLVGAVIGALTMWVGGWLSTRIRAVRGKNVLPFQAIVITLALLAIESGVLLVMR